MADYYPLLAKAVAAQAQSDPNKRRAIYERARTALLGQLRAIQPPIPEPDIQRESQALDEAVNRLESEIAAKDAAPARAAGESSAAASGVSETGRTRLPLRPLPPRPLPPRPPLRSRLEIKPAPPPPAEAPPEPPSSPEESPAPLVDTATDTAAQADTWQEPGAPAGGAASGFTLPHNRAEPEPPPLRPRGDQFHPAA
ncbi:MAG: hypothetical protein JOZ84_00525, partial [Methylobacteriaceae bacterium]|nr:hypothetical protein [Methylobacteriaceae bacterium]